jgi:hypothetical protein
VNLGTGFIVTGWKYTQEIHFMVLLQINDGKVSCSLSVNINFNIYFNIIFGDFTTTIGGFIIKNTQCFSTYSDNNNINLTFISKDKTIQRTITLGQDDNNASII